jgi:hypothetical protein
MGNLLQLIRKDERRAERDIFVDFESVCDFAVYYSGAHCRSTGAEPTAEELPVFLKVKEVLDRAPGIIKTLSEYTGAKEEIREVGFCLASLAPSSFNGTQAISNPSSEDAQKAAWDAVSSRVLVLKSFFDFSHDLGGSWSRIVFGLLFETRHRRIRRAAASICTMRRKPACDTRACPGGALLLCCCSARTSPSLACRRYASSLRRRCSLCLRLTTAR